MKNINFQQQLIDHRKTIDQCDQQIIKALAKRMKTVKEVGRLKKENNVPPLDQKRWQQVVETRKTLGKKLGLNPILISEVWEIFHKEALKIEKMI